MGEMLLRMSLATLFYVLVAYVVRRVVAGRPLGVGTRLLIGLVFGTCSVLSTHFGVTYSNMVLNVRDLGPLIAGLFFHPVSGIVAGVVGGVERYIAGRFLNIGAYTTVACSVSTLLAGLLAALLNRRVFRREPPRAILAFFIGAVTEVFHMYAVFLTHRNDVSNAYEVVRICSVPMILFTGLGMVLCAFVFSDRKGGLRGFFLRTPASKKSVSRQFQFWMLVAITIVFVVNFFISYSLETQSAYEEARIRLSDWARHIRNNYESASEGFDELDQYIRDDLLNETKMVSFSLEAAGGAQRVSDETFRSFCSLLGAKGLYVLDAKGALLRESGEPWTPVGRSMSGAHPPAYEDLIAGKTEEANFLDPGAPDRLTVIVRTEAGMIQARFDFVATLNALQFTDMQGIFTEYKAPDGANFLMFYYSENPDSDNGLLNGMVIASSTWEGKGPFAGGEPARSVPPEVLAELERHLDGSVFYSESFSYPALVRVSPVADELWSLVLYNAETAFDSRDAHMYENTFSDLLVFATLFIMVSVLMEALLADPLRSVNASLNRIINGNLEESVSVQTSSEFATLSRDINMTVDALKGYISAAEKRMQQELLMAKTIQASALPRNFDLPRDEFELYALMDPAREVGGDFYDFFFVGPNRLALVIADVSGKGIPASLFMMRSKTAIRNLAEGGKSPAEIMAEANHTLCEGNDAEMFVTVWLGLIDLETGEMVCANAGHEYPAILRAGGAYELLKDKHSMALAAMDGLPMKEYTLQLNPGDRLFVYTDGVPEAINEQVEQYGTDRMLDALNRHRNQPQKTLLPLVLENLRRFVGAAEQFDDITMLGFHFLRRTHE